MPETRAEAGTNRLRRTLIWFVTIGVIGVGVGLMTVGPSQTTDPNLQQGFRALGSFLTVTILLGFLYRVTVGPYDNARHEERIRTLLYGEIDRVYSAAKSYGFGGIEESLDFTALFENLKKHETLWWLDTYHPGYQEWIEAAEEALKSGARINMLVMHPKSAMLAHRATELAGKSYTPVSFRKELTTYRDQLRKLAQRHPKLLKIREYRDLPCAPIYAVTTGVDFQPQRAYSSYFLSQPTSFKFPHFVWRQGEQPFIDELFSYLKDKWERCEEQ